MNKEFIILSNGNVVVTNEFGTIIERENEKGLDEILLLENKIETIGIEISKMDENISEQDSVILRSKKLLMIQPVLLLLVTLIAFIYGGLTSSGNFLTQGILNAISGLALTTILTSPVEVYLNVIKSLANKKKIIMTEELNSAKRLKVKYEKALDNTKEIGLYKENILPINEPISLIEKTEEFESEMKSVITKKDTDEMYLKELRLVRRKK